jgi:hypothetical protein
MAFQNCGGGGGGGGGGGSGGAGSGSFQAPAFVTKWGYLGSYRVNGTFQTPIGVLWANGVLHASDGFGNQWIQKFDGNGTFINSFGTSGTGNGQFHGPEGMAADSSGNIYVVDSPNHRIQVFNSSGGYVRQWGSNGTGNGQFNYPYGVAVFGSTVYVTDEVNHRVQMFDTSGAYLGQWGSQGGWGPNQFQLPRGIVVDSSGNVYVANQTHEIRKFSSTGTYLATIGGQTDVQGGLFSPEGLAFDSAGNLYVTNEGRNTVSVFNPSGAFLGKWGGTGSGDGKFNQPRGIAIDPQNNVYVMDAGNFRIQKFGAASVGGVPIGGGGGGTFRLVVTKLPRRKNAATADNMNGTMTSSPAGITCANCYATSAALSGAVSLNTIFNAGTTGITWEGDCSGNTVTMDADKYCGFTYTDNNPTFLSTSADLMTLRVSKIGSGTVTSVPAGINCGAACTTDTATISYGGGSSSFSLIATPDAGFVFERWAGDCSGTSSNTSVTMDFNRACVAIFKTGSPPAGGYRLSVTNVTPSSNSGSILSTPGGVGCVNCLTTYGTFAANSNVMLSSSAAVNWSGDCAGFGMNTSGSLTMDSDKDCMFAFTGGSISIPNPGDPRPVTVGKTGGGSCTVTSSPGSINCGGVCSGNFGYQSSVQMTATPSAGSSFVKWMGSCSGTTPVVSMPVGIKSTCVAICSPP